MKRLELLCVGKIKEDYLNAGIAEYVKRLGRYCDVVVTALPDMPDSPTEAEEESKALSARFDGFVIGGSRGVTDELRRRADARVSFGRVTYPHKLMRLIAAEQLYRAFTIAEGLPYHK